MKKRLGEGTNRRKACTKDLPVFYLCMKICMCVVGIFMHVSCILYFYVCFIYSYFYVCFMYLCIYVFQVHGCVCVFYVCMLCMYLCIYQHVSCILCIYVIMYICICENTICVSYVLMNEYMYVCMFMYLPVRIMHLCMNICMLSYVCVLCMLCMVVCVEQSTPKHHKNLNGGDAAKSRDAMAKEVYRRLFGWIVDKVCMYILYQVYIPGIGFLFYKQAASTAAVRQYPYPSV